MTTTVERLLSLRAADVATPEVVCLSVHQTLDEAATILEGHHVSGAPVVDEHGHCVGVLSTTDLVRAARTRAEQSPETTTARCQHVLAQDGENDAYRIDELPDDLVGRHMSTGVQTIDPNARLIDAARMMCNAHIHRLIRVDDRGHPVGIISSLDLVAAMVAAVDEELGTVP